MEGWDLRLMANAYCKVRSCTRAPSSCHSLKCCGTLRVALSLLEAWLSPDVFSFSGAISACEKAWAVKRSGFL